MKIKFCGGCNPLYNRKEVYRKLIENDAINNKDGFIILNGCQRGCKNFQKCEINSQEYILKNLNTKIKEEALFNWIIEKIKGM
ncbi:MAG: hypothetical protein SOY60_01740 [Fusobacterium gastrosuis]|uniref:hypothetical protein n=1 Tax=Fusobacterium gastrosuis TaxID=1755100 RepID=UPI002977F5F2|nr:hypothetical protein [Fusobacteriaceae bacterium]MDD7410632.1 hypothetical protein [Fusobacteriaceae bacterium]MDY4010380.1 hypothetical protein [Fusobacterium gastrosuis]MDY5714220.1 hypothetical protein [Fusobacterium gastrosuis]